MTTPVCVNDLVLVQSHFIRYSALYLNGELLDQRRDLSHSDALSLAAAHQPFEFRIVVATDENFADEGTEYDEEGVPESMTMNFPQQLSELVTYAGERQHCY